ncbi:MAG: glycosyltransferase family 4 protein [Candidatus Delongbacteria bacterium]|nr:glycosyltransferase family 4 protein [Candidatus Delongbacteria bacterium]
MKILYVHQYFKTHEGAGGSRSYEFAKSLIDKGHRVTMLCSSSRNKSLGMNGEFIRGKRVNIIENIKVIQYDIDYSSHDNFFKRSTKFIKFSLRTIKSVFTEDYDLIFCSSTPLTVAIPGIIAKLFRRKKFVFEVRDLWPDLPRAMGIVTNPLVLAMMSALEKTAYNTADSCIGLSPGMVEGIKTRMKNKKKKVALIPNGGDIDLFKNEKGICKNIEGIREDDFVAVFTGAHGIANGLDSVLDACIILKEMKINDIKILFVGDGNKKKDLVARKDKEHLDNCVFMDPVPKKDIPAILKRADLGLMILKNIPDFYRGTSPNKFFDYLAAGIPVLNNYPGWVAGMIKENDCGYVVEPDEALLFAQALIEAKKDKKKGLLKQKGENSLRLAKEKFDRHSLASQFVDFIESS